VPGDDRDRCRAAGIPDKSRTLVRGYGPSSDFADATALHWQGEGRASSDPADIINADVGRCARSAQWPDRVRGVSIWTSGYGWLCPAACHVRGWKWPPATWSAGSTWIRQGRNLSGWNNG
jgi:hypothetical protein